MKPFRYLILFFFLAFGGGLIVGQIQPPVRQHWRVRVDHQYSSVVQPVLQLLDAKPEIELSSWDPQTAQADLMADPRVTQDILTQAFSAHHIKVLSITQVQP
jgi:hypothetical protein